MAILAAILDSKKAKPLSRVAYPPRHDCYQMLKGSMHVPLDYYHSDKYRSFHFKVHVLYFAKSSCSECTIISRPYPRPANVHRECFFGFYILHNMNGQNSPPSALRDRVWSYHRQLRATRVDHPPHVSMCREATYQKSNACPALASGLFRVRTV